MQPLKYPISDPMQLIHYRSLVRFPLYCFLYMYGRIALGSRLVRNY